MSDANKAIWHVIGESDWLYCDKGERCGGVKDDALPGTFQCNNPKCFEDCDHLDHHTPTT